MVVTSYNNIFHILGSLTSSRICHHVLLVLFCLHNASWGYSIRRDSRKQETHLWRHFCPSTKTCISMRWTLGGGLCILYWITDTKRNCASELKLLFHSIRHFDSRKFHVSWFKLCHFISLSLLGRVVWPLSLGNHYRWLKITLFSFKCVIKLM